MNDIYLSHFRFKDIGESNGIIKYLSSLLSPELNQRIDKIWGVQERIRSVFSKVMVYYELNKLDQAISPHTHAFKYSKKGNPFVEGTDINCSISYHNQLVSVAISRSAKVGIDVEGQLRNTRFNSIPDSLKGKLEALSINNWSELEAYSKYLTEGLRIVFANEKLSTENVEFKHLALEPDLDCCLVSDKGIRVHQNYITLDELMSFTNKFAHNGSFS